MPIPNLLIASTLQSAGNTVQVAELVGGTTINQIGADLSSTSFTPNTNVRKIVANVPVEYRGDIYCNYLTNNVAGIWALHRWNGSTWSNFDNYELTGQFPGGTGVYTDALGTWVVNTGTVQRIFSLAFNSGGGNVNMLYSDDGTTWNFVTLGTFSTFLYGGKHVLFNNKVYLLSANSVSCQVYEIDPIALTATFVSTGIPGSTQPFTTSAALGVYDDRLFLAVERQNTDFGLYEFTGGGWSFVVDANGQSMNFNTGNPERGAACMFTEPTTGDLIVIFNGVNASFNRGSFASRLIPSGSSFTVEDLSLTVTNPNGDGVIPTGLQPGARATTGAIEDRWFVVVSTNTPGSTEVYLFVAEGPAPGTGYAVYQWQGIGTQMSSVGVGPSTIYAIPEAPFGGGDRIYRNVANQAVIETAAAIPGGYRISYRVYGLQTNQNVTLWYSLGQEVPDQQAMSIIAQTGGSGITGSTTVNGITGDDGATLFTLDWDAESDGVAVPDAAHMFLDINP